MSDKLHQLAKKSKESKVEEAKKKSRLLRGTIAEALASDQPDMDHDDVALLKFHGSYQQEDRDARAVAKVTGGEKEYWFMVRVKVPGGALTAEQYLAMDRLADEVVHNRSLRVTTRQNFQLHGVLKTNLKKAIRSVNDTLLSTLCGCGDVERNIMAPPAPLADPAHREARALAQTISDAMCPKTNAYHEIWLDGEKVDSSQESEPIYGPQYLPRKFKTGIAIVDDNSADVHSQDLGLVALLDGERIKGLNVLVGGGFGMTHKKEETYARIGTPLGYVDAEHAVEIVQTVVGIFRDFGDRTDRTHARLKYILEECGMEAFRAEFQRRANFTLKPWVEIGPLRHQDWLGAHAQGDGKFFYGIWIENGRIIDTERKRMKTVLRRIVETMRPSVVLTPNQNILLGDLTQEQVEHVERILDAYYIPRVEQLKPVTRYSMACPALPTCGLALTESERYMPEALVAFEHEFQRIGADDTPITIRMTGCPNGCARPYTADIGLVGHKPDHYDVFVGGRVEGDRFADLYAVNVHREQLVPALRPLLEAWMKRRMPGEGLGDYYQRLFGQRPGRVTLTGSRDNPTREHVESMLITM